MSDAIQRRVDQFVEEILEVLEKAQGEGRAAALRALGAFSTHEEAAPRGKGARSPRTSAPPKSKRSPRPRRVVVEEPAPVVEPTTVPPPSETIPAPADGPAAEREVRVLDAVRALSRATAGEVAEHARQPNGSVVVTLRALVARGLVVRIKTDRGMEYGLAPRAAVA
jgi:hypothetical protein